MKYKILELPEMVGKTVGEVQEYVKKEYPNKLTTEKDSEYLLENPDKVPSEMKDGNWYYFMGSSLRYQVGNSFVPCVYWDGSKLRRSALWLGTEWSGSGRVVLLDTFCELNIETLNLRVEELEEVVDKLRKFLII